MTKQKKNPLVHVCNVDATDGRLQCPYQHKTNTMLLSLTAPDTAFEKIKQLQKLKLEKTGNIRLATLDAYWHLGAYLVLNEYTKTTQRLQYIADRLNEQFGRGFSRSNLVYMCKFFACYKAHEIQQSTLTWSHYFEILKSRSERELVFYTIYAAKEQWSVRELKDKMRDKFVYQVGLRRLMRINMDTRTIEEDRFTAKFLAETRESRNGNLFCETPQKPEHYAQARPAPTKYRKALHKLFRETRSQNTPAHNQTPRRKTTKTRHAKHTPEYKTKEGPI